MAKALILAAHPDDELIGCFRALNSGSVSSVIYFQQEVFDKERTDEAANLATYFGYRHQYLHVTPMDYRSKGSQGIFLAYLSRIYMELQKIQNDLPDEDKITEKIVVYAHSFKDKHAHHKFVSYLAKALPSYLKSIDRTLYNMVSVVYYSVDMEDATPLPVTLQAKKLKALDNFYPSQKYLWANDASYYLFESYSSDTETSVTVTFSYEGIHSYPSAPEEVSYLRHPHRHVFHVDASLEVFHDDRDVEFIMLKHELQKVVNGNMDNKSCERVARELVQYLQYHYPMRKCKVTVSEDRENSATVSAGL